MKLMSSRFRMPKRLFLNEYLLPDGMVSINGLDRFMKNGSINGY